MPKWLLVGGIHCSHNLKQHDTLFLNAISIHLQQLEVFLMCLQMMVRTVLPAPPSLRLVLQRLQPSYSSIASIGSAASPVWSSSGSFNGIAFRGQTLL